MKWNLKQKNWEVQQRKPATLLLNQAQPWCPVEWWTFDDHLVGKCSQVPLNQKEQGQQRNLSMARTEQRFWLTISLDQVLQCVKDRIRMRLWVSPANLSPISLQPLQKRGRLKALIVWEGNTPSCCHSVINSRSPHKKNTCKRYESLSCSQKSGGLMSISKLKAVKLRVEEKTATAYNNPTAELTNESLKLNNLLCPCLALEWHEGNAHTASRRK